MEKENVNNVTFLIDKLADASLNEILFTKRKEKLKSSGYKVGKAAVNKSTTASRARKVTKKMDNAIELKIKRIEKEMHAKFRILNEKNDFLERRIVTLEQEKHVLKNTNLELMKRIHQSSKAEVRDVLEELTQLRESFADQKQELLNLQTSIQFPKVRLEPEQENELKTRIKSKKTSSSSKLTTDQTDKISEKTLQFASNEQGVELFARMQVLEDQTISLRKQMLHVVNMSNGASENIHTNIAKECGSMGSKSEERLQTLKLRLKELERAVAAGRKVTSEALSDQKLALLFLYRHSNITSKANMSDREVETVFGKLGGAGALNVDNLW